ncbi:dihydrolipoyl dehydrogenase [Brevibacillus humidisoli]|uniref:dihydrolipoyl dehydrogenase n=1 Tax=Brevibacillus humidisoli TaxID=2895522 RepID=UPI001E46B5B0|nr:dihydrolipoyl dehydrogenase [Brevibacillus humidisoli]UFJ40870.1 dihydrolipoyl dehydrogenase [Brevibacillus humidisoli]
MRRSVLVIGGGPAGYTAAIRASQLGADVTLVEKGLLGGTCLNLGCIPTKSLLDSSHNWAKAAELFFSGHAGGPEHEKTENRQSGEMRASYPIPWQAMLDRKNEAVQQLRAGVVGLLQAGKIKVVTGTATFTPDRQVNVREANGQQQTLSADSVILAVGSRPILPPIPGMETAGVVTSDEILSLPSLPGSLAIIGGGVIGLEFATLFAEVGVKVAVIEAAQRVLPGMDADISQGLKAHLERKQVRFYTGRTVTAVENAAQGGACLVLSDGQRLQANLVLAAVGRKAALDELTPETAGLAVEQHKIKVNRYQQTNQPGIYAAGDCCSPMMLAHVAMAEARIAVEHALGQNPQPVAYDHVPQCVYSHPEAAAVGLTGEEAKKRGFQVQEGVFPLAASGRALVEGEAGGFLKIVADKQYGRVLGVHLLAPHATEMISEAALALTLEATVDELLQTIHPHPTVAEGLSEAVLTMSGQAIHLP